MLVGPAGIGGRGVGIAQADGVLDIEQSASTWIPEWKGTPSEAVTVRDLLSNDSGREWSVAIHYGQLLRSKDTTGFAIGLGQAAAPGEVKPSTRGWTMIMDDPAEAEAASGLSTPAAAAAPPPPSPTTRGWTMLEELNDSLPAGATPVTPQPAATPSAGVATEPSGVSNAPSSRGWTS